MADWHCSVEFAAPGHESMAVSFQDGKVSVLTDQELDAAISLFFLSSRQVVNQFAGKGISVPLPRKGAFRLGSLYRFHQLGKILEAEMEEHPRLLLTVALGSLRPLMEYDDVTRELMRHCPKGLAEFGVPANDLFGWAEWTGEEINWGRGRAPRRADVTVTFGSERVALAALRGELDELAAIGMGELSVRGRVPLAETIGAAMARADIYLERPVAKNNGGSAADKVVIAAK